MTTSVVTGGAGFVGSHLCEHLLDRGHRVICLDNLDTGTLENIEHLQSDDFVFRNTECTQFIDVPEPVDFVFHLASPASPIDYLRLPLHTLKVGSYGTHHTLGLTKFKRARFLLASSSEVYGDPMEHPQTESYWGNVNPIGPRGVYDEAKRYAEALTMAYHRQQGVNTCIARIFNSVLADEQILHDDGRALHRETAAELAARLIPLARSAVYAPRSHGSAVAMLDRPGAPATGAKEYPLEGYSVPAFDPDGTIASSRAIALIGHPTAQRCFKIVTRYGRSVKVTGDHSLFTEGPDGRPVPKPVTDMRVGENIAIAARIDVPERDRRCVNMLEVWNWAELDPWDLYIEAPDLGETVWRHRFDVFGRLATHVPGKGRVWRNGIWSRIIRMRQSDRASVPLTYMFDEGLPSDAGVRMRSAGKSSALPLYVEITDDMLWLLGLYVAEGCMHEKGKNAFVTISCDEALLRRAAAIIDRTLGLHVVWAKSDPAARSDAIFVHSTLLLRLLDYLGFDANRKRIPGWILGLPLSRLKHFLEGYREGDGIHSGQKLAEGVRHEFSTVHDELKDDLLVALGRFGLVPSIGRYEAQIRPGSGQRRYPFWRLTLPHVEPWSPLEWDQGVHQRLNARRFGDLVYARISSIEEIPATELVYDFSVPGHENFWAGGVMAKNTYGPKMRPFDGRAVPTFVRQALTGKPLTVFGDGSQTRSFCYVDDTVEGLIRLAESDAHEPTNIGNPDEHSLAELAELIIRISGSSSPIVHEALPVDDPKVRRPDIARAQRLLGWEPSTSLDEGLKRVIEYERRRIGSGNGVHSNHPGEERAPG
jgi:nucleoside-diphosphate-sugar epimerase